MINYHAPSAHQVYVLEIRLSDEEEYPPYYEILVDGQKLAVVFGECPSLPRLIVPNVREDGT